MKKIHILDEILASKIAAGEVVERPASVVKELIENSIDAGAKRIDIEIHNGGKSLIRVTDNGSGMNKEDALLSVERHATSKINNIDDLFNISTLGFRGEALPSIASVSRMELLTNDGASGTSVIMEGGKIVEQKEKAAPKGTSIIIKDLFFNTPARLKFLKSDSTEANHILDIVSKFLLSNPEISFKLTSNGRQSLSSSGNGELLDAISSVYGAAFCKNLIQLNPPLLLGEGLGVRVRGFISKPGETKINKDYQVFFVNNRYIKNYVLSRALESAYQNLIPKDRHPIGFIFIDIDPKEVDVNVHPTKKEIKFLKTNEVMRGVSEAAKATLIDTIPAKLISEPVFIKEKSWTSQAQRIWAENIARPISEHHLPGTENQVQYEVPSTSTSNIRFTAPENLDLQSPLPVTPVCQFRNTYIICIDGDDLVLIDQHAAHERILYEKIRSKRSTQQNSQYCLIAEIIELNSREFSKIEENIPLLTDLGFEAEIFGKNSIRIKAVPSDVTKINLKQLLTEMAQQLDKEFKPGKIDEVKDKIAKLVACHGAIKAGDLLKPEEINNLIKDLFSTSNPSTCPHGRPSIIRIESSKIAKLFDRHG